MTRWVADELADQGVAPGPEWTEALSWCAGPNKGSHRSRVFAVTTIAWVVEYPYLERFVVLAAIMHGWRRKQRNPYWNRPAGEVEAWEHFQHWESVNDGECREPLGGRLTAQFLVISMVDALVAAEQEAMAEEEAE